MTDREYFRQSMLCGHGRCFSLLCGNEEAFRDIVLYGCTHDISFDLQSEGSRGAFMYELAQQYPDSIVFTNAVIRQLFQKETDTDWHSLCHLGDYLTTAANDGSPCALQALEEKYVYLYHIMMSRRWSNYVSEVQQSWEYLAILLMQSGTAERTIKICTDIGAWFLRRRRESLQLLKWQFAWFWSCCEKSYGNVLHEKLQASNVRELKLFYQVMNSDEKKPERPASVPPTAEGFLLSLSEETVSVRTISRMARLASDAELRQLAQTVIDEPDDDRKAVLLRPFTFRKPFPLAPEYLLTYASSASDELRNTAKDALALIRADCVHDYALRILQDDAVHALPMLICNFRPDDRQTLLSALDSLIIDKNAHTEWHAAAMNILDEQQIMPDDAFLWIYSHSMCSDCRRGAVEVLLRRNALTSIMTEECRHDADLELRALVMG